MMARTWSLTTCGFIEEMKKIQAKDMMCLILVPRALVHDDRPVELHTPSKET
jgi:hypothetical protein